mmetsp:Transcript_30123/g.48157  ORF Transcript_30123/g.48157 Transcript_30123/m.48157 type:complete len:342 (+) Transcript_30123:1-1026(+)
MARNNEMIQSEQQFRSAQNEKIAHHTSYIAELQKASFVNTQQFTAEDTETRNQLRGERLQWNAKLHEMTNTMHELNGKFDSHSETLRNFAAGIDKIVEECQIAAASKDAKTKKKAKSKPKPKPKAKSKKSEGCGDISLSFSVSNLVEQCKDIEDTVPMWLYGDQIRDCHSKMTAILYRVLMQCNTQFSKLVDHKLKVRKLDNEVFDASGDKYIALCLQIFEQLRMMADWKHDESWSSRLQEAQNESDDVWMAFRFAKLQSVVPMNEEVENEENEETTEQDVQMALQYWNEIEFSSEVKKQITMRERCIELKEKYANYVSKVEEWIKQKQEQEETSNVAENK